MLLEAIPCQHAKRIDDRYFLLIRKEREFDTAEQICQTMGGHLASIHSLEEDIQVKDYIKKNG